MKVHRIAVVGILLAIAGFVTLLTPTPGHVVGTRLITSVQDKPRSFEGGLFEISSRLGNDHCFDIPDACVSARLQSVKRNGHNNQKFLVRTDEPTNWFHIISAYSNLCLEVPNGDGRDGVIIQQAPCIPGADKQAWRIKDDPGGGFYMIYWKGNEHKVMDLTNNDERNGIKIQLYEWHGGLNQAWDLRPTKLNTSDSKVACGGSGGGTPLLVVQSLKVSPNSISLGERATITVTLNRPVETDGYMISPNVDSNGAEATFDGPYPFVIGIPKGSRTGSYTLQSRSVRGAATSVNFYFVVGFDKIGDHLTLH
jgi:hypothetical protein